MRSYLMAVILLILLLITTAPALAQTAADPDAALEHLLRTLNAPGATDQPRLLRTDDGYVRFLGAPEGGRFVTESSATKSAAPPETVARDFVLHHADAWGVPSLRQGFKLVRVSASDGRKYVRLQQTYHDFTVLGAQMLVQLDSGNGVECVSSDIMRDSRRLDSGEIALAPKITPAMAEMYAKGYIAGHYNVNVSTLSTSDTERMIFDPSVLGAPGELCVVYNVTVFSTTGKRVIERVFVNVANGAVAFNFPLVHDAMNRYIWDGENRFPPRMNLVRSEGTPPSGIHEADVLYDYLGDTYNFYFNIHGRDSIDDNGMPIRSTINLCFFGECPMMNAFWLGDTDLFEEYWGMPGNSMYYGAGWGLADDIVAHEYTHGVTQFSSNLIYAYQSGAINESFSDIWGEFVDLTNNRGNDSPEVRWLMGEDSPIGAFRNMKDPTQFGDPDRLGSPYYYWGEWDHGGVHWNSGVINKLCYLLTDGDTFNGHTVEGMGIEKTAQLFYECQVNLLTEGSDFADLYMALGQATSNLGYTLSEKLNVRSAARAVEIAPRRLDQDIRMFRAVPAYTNRNRPVIALYWELPQSPSLRQVILVRGAGRFPRTIEEGVEIYRGRDEKFLDDQAITAGVTYYYALFADVTEGFPSAVYASATAGEQPHDFLSEEFLRTPYYGYTVNPFNLSYSQIMFSPTGAPTAPIGSAQALGDYSNYTVTVRRDVGEFPVQRGEADNAAYELNLTEDGGVWFGMDKPFPFFQREHTRVWLAANGYLAFESLYLWDNRNFPSYWSHFAIPRISFLFADLAPKIGGLAWLKGLEDRAVITFETMPQWNNYVYPPAINPNCVQVELFYSGHIRITYGHVNIDHGVIGLSDGRGMPRNPADLFEHLQPASFSTKFSSIPQEPSALSFNPVVPPVIEMGELAEFTAQTTRPAHMGNPSMRAEWDREGIPTFLDEGNGTGHFRWQTGINDIGETTVRVLAHLANQVAYQDVRVWVDITEPLPSAVELGISTNNAIEDPTRSRTVSIDTGLTAQYVYRHPLQYDYPNIYGEGNSQIMWFQNHSHRSQWNNMNSIPATATGPNDRWFFQVWPVTRIGQWSDRPFMSPVVTVVALPEIFGVARIQDLPEGDIYPDDFPLPGVPIASGPSAGGTQLAIFGRRLRNPVSVEIGGIKCASIQSVGESRINVVTPAHAPSPIVGGSTVPETIVITTAAGTSAFQNGFIYYKSGTSISKADINKDGAVDAIDVQLVINAVLAGGKSAFDADVNRDGRINSLDIQAVINEAVGAL